MDYFLAVILWVYISKKPTDFWDVSCALHRVSLQRGLISEPNEDSVVISTNSLWNLNLEVAEIQCSNGVLCAKWYENAMVLHLLDTQFCALFANVALCVKQFPINVTNPNEVLYLLPDFSWEGFQMCFHLYMPAFYPRHTIKSYWIMCFIFYFLSQGCMLKDS